MIVDPGASSYSGWTAFTFNLTIGRENGFGNVAARADWMHSTCSETRHPWYNSFHHGWEDDGTACGAAINHVYNNYNSEAWVVGSDQIYSYLLVRENCTVTYTGSGQDQSGLSIGALTASPSSVVNDQANDITFSVTATDDNGTVSSVTLDLSQLGGGSSVAMTGSGGGAYTYTHTLAQSASTGTKSVTATATDNDSNQKTASTTVSVSAPGPVETTQDVYTDANPLNAGVGWAGNGTATEISTGAVEGVNCIEFTFTIADWWAGFGIAFNNWNTTIDATGYETLRMSIKGGGGLSGVVGFGYGDGSDTGQDGFGIPSTADWTTVDIPLTHYTNQGYAVTDISSINIVMTGQSGSGTFYIDDVKLVSTGGTPVTIGGCSQSSPRTGMLRLTLGGDRVLGVSARTAGTLRVYDLAGKAVGTARVSPSTAQWTLPAAGTYFVQLSNGHERDTRRIIVR
jgi:hypothetical protein